MLISSSIQNKTLQRLRLIISGGVSSIIRSLGNMVVALLVVKLFSATLWGQFVFYLMMIDLAFNIINWGHRSFLLREFSLHPNLIKDLLHVSLQSRILLLICGIAILWFLPFSIYLKLLITIWAIGRFMYQSLEPLNTYRRDYNLSILTETIGYIIIILPIVIFTNTISFEILIILYTLSFIIKSILYSIFYKFYLPGKIDFKNTRIYFKRSLPFMLVGISSLVAVRADLYIVAAFLEEALLAQYQIFISFLLLSHFASSILLAPFEKNIYRLKRSGLKKIQKQIVLAATFATPLLIGLIYLFIDKIFEFNLSWLIYLSGAIYIYLFFIYQLRLFQFAKYQQQQMVTAIIFIAGILNIILSLILVPLFEMEGAILAALSAQLFIAVILHIKNPSNSN